MLITTLKPSLTARIFSAAVKTHLISYSLNKQNIRERAISAGDGDASEKRLFKVFFDGGISSGHRGDLIYSKQSDHC